MHFPDNLSPGASFHCLLANCLLAFFGEVTVQVFGSFSNWVPCFLLLSFKCSLYILDNNPLSGMSFANCFSQSVSSHPLDGLFCKATVFNEVQLINYLFHAFGACICAFGAVSKKSSPNPRSSRFSPMLSSRYGFIWKCLDSFFCMWMSIFSSMIC